MKKKQISVGFTDKQMEHLKAKAGAESVATYIRQLVDKDMKRRTK